MIQAGEEAVPGDMGLMVVLKLTRRLPPIAPGHQASGPRREGCVPPHARGRIRSILGPTTTRGVEHADSFVRDAASPSLVWLDETITALRVNVALLAGAVADLSLESGYFKGINSVTIDIRKRKETRLPGVWPWPAMEATMEATMEGQGILLVTEI